MFELPLPKRSFFGGSNQKILVINPYIPGALGLTHPPDSPNWGFRTLQRFFGTSATIPEGLRRDIDGSTGWRYCWWFRNAANHLIWQISHYLEGQLRLVVCPIIYKVLAPSQVVLGDFWTINSMDPRLEDELTEENMTKSQWRTCLSCFPGIQTW